MSTPDTLSFPQIDPSAFTEYAGKTLAIDLNTGKIVMCDDDPQKVIDTMSGPLYAKIEYALCGVPTKGDFDVGSRL